MSIPRKSRLRRGFTLIELLVVVGIIAMASVLALPAVNKFLKGQKLTAAGRLVQAAFNDARRAAITQRTEHYVFIGHKAGTAAQDADVYGLKAYRKGKGWEAGEIILPSGVVPVFDDGPTTTSWNTASIWGCKMQVQDWSQGPPLATATTDLSSRPFATASLTIGAGCKVFEFRKDGTVNLLNGVVDVPPLPVNGVATDIYDMQQTISWVNMGAGPPGPTAVADIVLRQIGDPSKRCFIDIDINTGRVRYRVAETIPQDDSSTTSGGIGGNP